MLTLQKVFDVWGRSKMNGFPCFRCSRTSVTIVGTERCCRAANHCTFINSTSVPCCIYCTNVNVSLTAMKGRWRRSIQMMFSIFRSHVISDMYNSWAVGMRRSFGKRPITRNWRRTWARWCIMRIDGVRFIVVYSSVKIVYSVLWLLPFEIYLKSNLNQTYGRSLPHVNQIRVKLKI